MVEMTEAKEFVYDARQLSYNCKDTFDWTSYQSLSIKSVVMDEIFENDVHIVYETHGIILDMYKDDSRDIDNMDKSRCTRPAYGCCLDHCGCGEERCLEHYPLQKIDIEYDPEKLQGKCIVGFEHVEDDEYSYAYHKFNFLLSDGAKVPFSITNSSQHHGFMFTVRVDDDT